MAAKKARMSVDEVLQQVLDETDNDGEIEDQPTLSEVVERSVDEFKRLSRSIDVFAAFREEASAFLRYVYSRHEITRLSTRELVLSKFVKVGPMINEEVSVWLKLLRRRMMPSPRARNPLNSASLNQYLWSHPKQFSAYFLSLLIYFLKIYDYLIIFSIYFRYIHLLVLVLCILNYVLGTCYFLKPITRSNFRHIIVGIDTCRSHHYIALLVINVDRARASPRSEASIIKDPVKVPSHTRFSVSFIHFVDELLSPSDTYHRVSILSKQDTERKWNLLRSCLSMIISISFYNRLLSKDFVERQPLNVDTLEWIRVCKLGFRPFFCQKVYKCCPSLPKARVYIKRWKVVLFRQCENING